MRLILVLAIILGGEWGAQASRLVVGDIPEISPPDSGFQWSWVGNPDSLRRIKEPLERIQSPIGAVVLTAKRWAHIVFRHPEVSREELWWAVAMPDRVFQEDYRTWIFQRWGGSNWLNVVVRQIGEEFFIITAYFKGTR